MDIHYTIDFSSAKLPTLSVLYCIVFYPSYYELYWIRYCNYRDNLKKYFFTQQARGAFICDQHKSKIQSARSKRQRTLRHSDDSENDSEGDSPEVDFYSLQVQTLRRYKKFYKVSTRPGMNKAQLADLISKHFRTIQVKEKEVLTYFIYSVKNNSNKNGYND